jgi:SnoaL-like domain
MMRDYDRFASLFTQDGAWRMPHINVEFVSREEIRAGIERLQGLWDFFMQTVHPGTIQLEGDTGVGRAYISEFGRFRDGSSHLNYAVYHDRYQRTPDGWRFTERAYEIKYLRQHSAGGLGAPHSGGRSLTSDRRRLALFVPFSGCCSRFIPECGAHRRHARVNL